jgi:hypothetical protein
VAVIEDFRLVGVSPQFQPFEPSPTNALCLSFDAHYESNDVMQKTVPFGPPPRISNPIILSRQPCPKTRVPKINPIKDCLALGNRIELECIVLRAFPAHVNDLILNFLDDVANGLLAVWIKFRDKILCNSVLISVACWSETRATLAHAARSIRCRRYMLVGFRDDYPTTNHVSLIQPMRKLAISMFLVPTIIMALSDLIRPPSRNGGEAF